MPITAPLLTALGAPKLTAPSWAPILSDSCAKYAITTDFRVAAFIANIMHESNKLGALIENLNYTPEALIRVWPSHFGPENAQRLGRTKDHPADQHMIAELAYGGRLGNGKPGTGDGFKFRGRGLIMLTGRANYEQFAKVIGVPTDALVTLLESPKTAAEVAAAYWKIKGCNEVADNGNIIECRRLVQGGTLGLAEVTTYYGKALKLLRPDQTPLGTTAITPHVLVPTLSSDRSSDDLNSNWELTHPGQTRE